MGGAGLMRQPETETDHTDFCAAFFFTATQGDDKYRNRKVSLECLLFTLIDKCRNVLQEADTADLLASVKFLRRRHIKVVVGNKTGDYLDETYLTYIPKKQRIIFDELISAIDRFMHEEDRIKCEELKATIESLQESLIDFEL